MKHLTNRLRRVGLFCAVPVLATLVFTDLAAVARGASAPAQGQDSRFTLGGGIADFRFPEPKRFVIVQDEREKIRKLYTTGDVLFHPQNPVWAVRIQRIDAGGLVLRESRTGRKRSLRPGHPIPDLPGVTFLGTVMLTQLQYRFKVVAQVTQADPVLVSLLGSQAILEKEVSHLPPQLSLPTAPKRAPLQTKRPRVGVELFEQVRVKEIDDHTYEVDGTTLKPVIEIVGQVLSDPRTKITPTFSSQTGIGLHMTSALGDGTLSRSGFTVERPGVAHTFGVQLGDTIVSFNGRPVSSPINAWRTYQELFIKNRSLTELRVQIHRNGARLTKTFRIR